MLSRQLGRTGPTVSAIGPGAMGMSPDLCGPVDETEALATIHPIVDLQIEYAILTWRGEQDPPRSARTGDRLDGVWRAVARPHQQDGAKAGDWPLKSAQSSARLILNGKSRFHRPAIVHLDGGKGDLKELDALVDVLIAGLKAQG